MLWLGVLLFLQTPAPAGRATESSSEVAALVARAQAARYQQDSSLATYQAVVRQRFSGGIGLARGLVGTVGRERLAARIESVARVGWHHEHGAWGEIIGARSVVPIVGELDMDAEDDDIALVLPYYPGRDRLWPISELRDAMPNADDWIEHPLGTGADSLYRFSGGDSLGIRLPDGGIVRVREIRVRPRRPDSRLVVGSLWVDVESGSLVRAAYRPSLPMDLWPFMEREIGRNDRDKVQKFGPFTGTIREIIVEHGLYERRFWLPRTRIASADGTAKGGRVTISIQQTFRYERVSALAPGQRSAFAEPLPDLDPRDGRVRRPVWRNVDERSGRCRERGDTSARWSPDSLMRDDRLTVMHAEGVRFRVLLPCDDRDLITAPELPRSIYDAGEELFTDVDFNALRRDVEGALGLSNQAKWLPLPPTVHYGVDRGLLRYNRVEALSAGVSIHRVLGAGYSAQAIARLGVGDLYTNAELTIERSNVRSRVQASAYRRLTASNDWGDPLGLGASAVAALFGRDDGFYYRALGGNVEGSHRSADDGAALSWRAFGERHTSATVTTHESLAHLINGQRFQPNIVARAGWYFGGMGGLGYAKGSDPGGTRLTGALRAEGASGESAYGRFMMEHTINQGLGRNVQATLTGAAGTSAGTLPPQRLWYVGDAYTVRGYRAGEVAGDAFWLGRAELAKGHPLIRPAVFADVGWAGSRRDWNRQRRPLVGVGAGVSAVDGLLRLDVSHGLERDRLWRVDAYLEVR